jgi:hypothetical protein
MFSLRPHWLINFKPSLSISRPSEHFALFPKEEGGHILHLEENHH